MMKLTFTSIIVSALFSASIVDVDAFSVLRPNTAMTSIQSITSPTTTSLRAMYFADETEEQSGSESEATSSSKKSKSEEKKKDNDKEEIASMSGNTENDVKSTMSESIYDKLGFQEDQIALGIEPEDVLEMIGNRDDMIERFIKDNDGKLDKESAAKEVDKFMMDSEMVNMLVSYERAKAAGQLPKDEGPAYDWFTILVGGYLVYVVGSTVKRVIDRQEGAGVDAMDVMNESENAAGAVMDTVQGAVDAVQTSVDVAQNTLLDSVQSTVPDAIQSTIDIASSSM